jgi:hypothetical protein
VKPNPVRIDFGVILQTLKDSEEVPRTPFRAGQELVRLVLLRFPLRRDPCVT